MRSRYVAELVGTNVLRRTAASSMTLTSGHRRRRGSADGDVYVAISATVSVHRREPEVPQRVAGVPSPADLLGDRVRLHVQGEISLVAESPAAVGSASTVWRCGSP
jgi:hypothetical protein